MAIMTCITSQQATSQAYIVLMDINHAINSAWIVNIWPSSWIEKRQRKGYLQCKGMGSRQIQHSSYSTRCCYMIKVILTFKAFANRRVGLILILACAWKQWAKKPTRARRRQAPNLITWQPLHDLSKVLTEMTDLAEIKHTAKKKIVFNHGHNNQEITKSKLGIF